MAHVGANTELFSHTPTKPSQPEEGYSIALYTSSGNLERQSPRPSNRDGAERIV